MEFENLDSRPGIFVGVLEFLIISVQEFSCYTSSKMSSLTTTHCALQTYSVCVITWSVHYNAAFIENMGVSFPALRVLEFIEKVLEFFDIGRS